MTDCTEYEILISCLVDGEITSEEKAALDAHLESCCECRELLKYMRSVCSVTGELEKEPPKELLAGVMAAVRQPAVRKKPHFRARYYAAAAAMLAVIIFAVAALPQLTGGRSKGSTMENASADMMDMATAGTTAEAPEMSKEESMLGAFGFAAGGDSADGMLPEVNLMAPSANSASGALNSASENECVVSKDAVAGEITYRDAIPDFGREFCMLVVSYGQIELPEGAQELPESGDAQYYAITAESAEALMAQGLEGEYTFEVSDDALLIIAPEK